MYKISFYKNSNGKEPVYDYLVELSLKTGMSDRSLFKSITAYIDSLSDFGLGLGMPRIRRIDKELWELRPKRYRIFFFQMSENEFVLLHYYFKKSRKTPESEIRKAHKEIEEVLGR